MPWIAAFLAAGLAFAALDIAWLTWASGAVYRPALGSMLLEKPNLVPAVAFYGLYLVGLVVLAVKPGGGQTLVAAAMTGAFLGLVAYGTYDLTNLATLRGFTAQVALIDMAWGAFASATAAAAGAWAAARFN